MPNGCAGHAAHGEVGFIELLGTGLHPLFELLVDYLQILGQEVGAHDHGVDLIARFGDLHPGGQVPCREPDDPFEEQLQAGIVGGIHACFGHD